MVHLTWEPPERHPSIDSTNLEAARDPRIGRVVVADHQSAGRGRRGRTWSSPPGTGMAISAVVPGLPPAVVGWLPMVAGLAVVRALVDSRWPLDTVLKWPNDVLVEAGPRPGKLCGVLTQAAADDCMGRGSRGGKDDDGKHDDPHAGGAGAVSFAVVIGAGVNVDHAEDQLPVPTATSWRLARGGAPLPDAARKSFLDDYLRHLAELHDTLAAGHVGRVRTAYLDRSATLGRPVVVHRPGGSTDEGRAVDLAVDGALVVEGFEGRVVHHAGDVEHLRRGSRST